MGDSFACIPVITIYTGTLQKSHATFKFNDDEPLDFAVTGSPNEPLKLTAKIQDGRIGSSGRIFAHGEVSADRASFWLSLGLVRIEGSCRWDAGRYVLTETGYSVVGWAALVGERVT